jgi:hypothetical protein
VNWPRGQSAKDAPAATLPGVLERRVLAAPASLWLAAAASVALIVGGRAPWATAWGFISLDSSRLHGTDEVWTGVVSLALLVLYRVRGTRAALLVAAAGGALGAVQAVVTLVKISSGGALTLFGVEYRYVNAAWGLYLVRAAALALAGSAALTWVATRDRKRVGSR